MFSTRERASSVSSFWYCASKPVFSTKVDTNSSSGMVSLSASSIVMSIRKSLTHFFGRAESESGTSDRALYSGILFCCA